MASKREIKKYFKLLNKFKIISENIFQKGENDENQSSFSLCLTEIYFYSLKIIDLIGNISKINVNSSKINYDQYVQDLVDLEIIIYDEIMDWMKQLRRPLQKAAGEITYRRDDVYKKKKDGIKRKKCKTVSCKKTSCR